MTTTVKQGQSFFDKVLECTGSIDNVFEMALLNGIGITDALTAGTILQASPVTDKRIVALWNENNAPATMIALPIKNDVLENDYLLPGIYPLSF